MFIKYVNTNKNVCLVQGFFCRILVYQCIQCASVLHAPLELTIEEMFSIEGRMRNCSICVIIHYYLEPFCNHLT